MKPTEMRPSSPIANRGMREQRRRFLISEMENRSQPTEEDRAKPGA